MQTKKSGKSLADEITMLITDNEFQPGQRLDEVTLAKRFNVSRTPIRDAFSLLLARGILARRERRGVQVAETTKEMLAEMYEAMGEIEALCARLAARRISWLQRSELEAAQKECENSAANNDRKAFLAANDRFHLAIYKATQNAFIERLATEFRANTAPFRAQRFRAADDLRLTVDQHQRIVAAVTGSASEQAGTDMRSHIDEVGRRAVVSENWSSNHVVPQ